MNELDPESWAALTRRTGHPKLGWLRGRLEEAGVEAGAEVGPDGAERILVRRGDLAAAERILSPVDAMPDDHEEFRRLAPGAWCYRTDRTDLGLGPARVLAVDGAHAWIRHLGPFGGARGQYRTCATSALSALARREGILVDNPFEEDPASVAKEFGFPLAVIPAFAIAAWPQAGAPSPAAGCFVKGVASLGPALLAMGRRSPTAEVLVCPPSWVSADLREYSDP
jgi:hypothetical protein